MSTPNVRELSRAVARAMRQAAKHRQAAMEPMTRLESAAYEAVEAEMPLVDAPQRLWSKVLRRVQAAERHELERRTPHPHAASSGKRVSQSALRHKARQQMLEQLGAGHRLVF